MTYNDAPQDFQPTELRENDYDHQAKINKINKMEISGACVDNYHQADRLVQAMRYKYREGIISVSGLPRVRLYCSKRAMWSVSIIPTCRDSGI